MDASRVLSFERDVHSTQCGGVRVFHCDPGIKDVVSVSASFYTFPNYLAGDELVQDLAVGLLDKGSLRRDRFQIATALEDRGAVIDFQPSGLRVRAFCRCLKEHADEVARTMRELLTEPLFSEEEFDKAKALYRADLLRSLESTSVRAGALLSRDLYPDGHPNFSAHPEDDLRALESIDLQCVRTFYDGHFGAGNPIVCVVGDIGRDQAERLAELTLGGSDQNLPLPTYPDPVAESRVFSDTRFDMPDRPNVDVRIGQHISLRRDSPMYIPLYVGNFALGGNFSARLMRVIRDELGLTYGISSSLVGIETEHDGHWRTGVTLSTANLNEGVTKTLHEIRDFLDQGVNSEELETVQTTIAGSFQVGLNSTAGISAALLTNAERGFGLAYLDRFPDAVRSLNVDNVNEALRTLLDPDTMAIVAVGSLPGGPTAA